jgi:hypothetical protein
MAWDAGAPAAGIQARYIDDGIRANNAAINAVIGAHLTAGTAITATAAELNVLHGITKTTAALNQGEFPAGTIMLFGQNSAPTGWTRKADWTDNAMLCYAASGNIGSGGSVNAQSAHTHTGPSHTHTGPSHTHSTSDHTHTGPSHTHTGPSHAHAATGLTVSTYHRHNYGVAVGGAGFTTDAGFGYYSDYQGNASTAVAGNTAAEGTGATGAAGTGATGAAGAGNTGASGTGATSASGTAATGSNSAPLYQEVIAAAKDA